MVEREAGETTPRRSASVSRTAPRPLTSLRRLVATEVREDQGAKAELAQREAAGDKAEQALTVLVIKVVRDLEVRVVPVDHQGLQDPVPTAVREVTAETARTLA